MCDDKRTSSRILFAHAVRSSRVSVDAMLKMQVLQRLLLINSRRAMPQSIYITVGAAACVLLSKTAKEAVGAVRTTEENRVFRSKNEIPHNEIQTVHDVRKGYVARTLFFPCTFPTPVPASYRKL